MATYAIGDIQGCFDSLQRLLDHVAFDPGRDRLWLVGDLVNRGPKSLQVLRWARSLGDRVTAVLGNHDLHLLFLAAGLGKKKRLDTLDEVLAAPDRDELIDWLRHRSLLYQGEGHVMVHAGLHPEWSIEQAVALAAEVEAVLRAADWRARIGKLYCNPAPVWEPYLTGDERLQAILSVLIKIRACTPSGRMAHDFAGPAEDTPTGYMPWFAVPHARWRHDHVVVFGHWSALGLYQGKHCIGLDTGCVWGNQMSALNLDTDQIVQVRAAEPASQRPG